MSTLNSNPIAKAVRYALIAGTAAAVAMPAAFAAEDEAAAKETKVTITGSRIKRVDVETAQPITVITREELDMSGDTSVADALRNTSANTFGSWKAQSGYGAGYSGSAEIDLRGVGATLVLIDGRRMPGAGYDGGQTQDLNNIPLAIVERIEILRSGASAIYGSDAVAGVVNIITRKEMDGAEFSVLYEQRGVDDGSKVKYEFAAGVTGEKGSMIVTAEHQTVDEMVDNDVTGFDNGVSWYSPVANAFYYSQGYYDYYLDEFTNDYDPAVHGDYATAEEYANDQNIENWPAFFDASLCGAVPNTINNGYRCGYAYSNATWLYPQQDQDSIMTKFNYEVNSNLSFNARISFVNAKSHSRYAPTPISTATPTMSYDNPLLPPSIASDIRFTGDNSRPTVNFYHRSALLGNRDSYLNKTAYDAVFGFEGFLDAGSGFDWSVNYQRTVSSENLQNTNLINDRMFQAGVDNGEFDVFNVGGMTPAAWSAHAIEFYRSVAHTGTLDVAQRKDIVDGTFGGEIMSNDLMTANFVVGGEFENLDFTYRSDPESGQGYISGGSGGDDVFANRERTAAYAEFAFAFDFGLEATVAARYDGYDMEGDVGDSWATKTFSDTTTMFSLAYRPMDTLLIRAVVGESFRAPSMNELFASRSFGFPDGYDYYYCEPVNPPADSGNPPGLGNPANDPSYCDVGNLPQMLYWSGGNPSLNPESGDNISFGAVWNVTDDLVVEAQYYHLEYVDKIGGVSLDRILELNWLAGGETSAVVRGSNGQVEYVNGGTINQDSVKTFGWDYAVSYNMDTSIGKFNIKADLTNVSAFDETTDGILYRNAGLRGAPEIRANLQVSWAKDDYYAAWRTNYISAQETTSSNPNILDLDAIMYHNVQFGMYTPWDGEVVLGIRNLLDEGLPFNSTAEAWRDFNTTLYSAEGRTWTLRYEQKF